MLEFTLQNQRILHLQDFFALTTDRNNHTKWLNTMPERVNRHFDKPMPIYISNGPDKTLPPITCIALFISTLVGEERDVSTQNSYLSVCWFVDSLDTSIRDIVYQGIAGLNWELHAKDEYSDW